MNDNLIPMVATVVLSVIAAAPLIYFLVTNITFKTQPERYTYRLDKDGNESVRDNTDTETLS